MLEASIEMLHFLEVHNHLKMRVVDVRIHPEEALQDRLDDVAEVGRERSPCWHHNFQQEHMINVQFAVLCAL